MRSRPRAIRLPGRRMAGMAACRIPPRAVRNMIQIGTEGGFLPAPVVIPNQPVNYDYNRRDIVVLNVQTRRSLWGRRSGPTSSLTSPQLCRQDRHSL